MKNKSIVYALPVLFGFFVMGFCDIAGFSSDYVQRAFGWSDQMTGFVPSLVFIWFLFLGIPVGNLMNSLGRKNTVMVSMAVTIVGSVLPLIAFGSVSCMIAYSLLGIGNAILQVSLNPLLGNVIKDDRLMTSSLTAGQVIKAVSSLVGPEIIIFATAKFGAEHWYYCFPILGLITLLSAAWLLATPIEREETSAGSGISFADTLGLLKDRTILLLFLGILFIVGVDVSTNYISSKLMTLRFGWDLEHAKIAPQTYFFCRTAGALLGTVLLSKISGIKYFRVNIIACAIAAGAMIAVSNPVAGLVCIGAVGFFASSIFSIIYSLALTARPDKANQISGLMITAIAGGGIVTPAIGFAIGAAGIGGGIAVTLLCALYLVFCSFFAVRKA